MDLVPAYAGEKVTQKSIDAKRKKIIPLHA